MVNHARAQRIAQRIQEELADLLTREAGDPRLALITVTGVDVDRELAFATIYVSALDTSDRQDEILQALVRARRILSQCPGDPDQAADLSAAALPMGQHAGARRSHRGSASGDPRA